MNILKEINVSDDVIKYLEETLSDEVKFTANVANENIYSVYNIFLNLGVSKDNLDNIVKNYFYLFIISSERYTDFMQNVNTEDLVAMLNENYNNIQYIEEYL